MYIAEPSDRKKTATSRQTTCGPNARSISTESAGSSFGRQLQYFATLPFDYSLEESPRAVLDSVWKDARALWEAKPEDC